MAIIGLSLVGAIQAAELPTALAQQVPSDATRLEVVAVRESQGGQQQPAALTLTAAQHSIVIPEMRFHTVAADPNDPDKIWTWGAQNSDGVPLASMFYVDNHRISLSAKTQAVMTALPRPIAHHHSEVIGDYGVIVGGMSVDGSNNFQSSADVMTVNMTTGATAKYLVLPVGVHDPEGAVSNGKLVYWGGHAGSYTSIKAGVITLTSGVPSVESFDLYSPRVYSTAHVRDDGKVVAIAGYNIQPGVAVNVASIELLDPVAKTSILLGNLPVGVRYHSSRKVGNYAYVIGGTASNASGRPPASGSIYRVNLASGAVDLVGQMVHARYHAQTLVVHLDGKDYIVSFGGQSADKVHVTSIEAFDIAAGESFLLSANPVASIDHDRLTVVIGNKAWVFGGEKITQIAPGNYASAGTKALHELTFNSGATLSRE